MKKINRREFIKQISIVTFGFISFSRLIASKSLIDKIVYSNELIKDPNGILNLPKGFSYKIISKFKDTMDDGLMVPNAADGMGCFKGIGNNIILIRNHELGHVPLLRNAFKTESPFGQEISKFIKKYKDKFYDIKNKRTECFGCTTTIVYDTKRQLVKKQYLSLAGTLINCSGGVTPWNTWISCEETVKKKSGKITKNHGYNFEVIPSEKIKMSNPIPLKAMGRFRHEAIAVDPKNNYVYQTEDREDGLIYRFIPNVKNDLSMGGGLQGLVVKNIFNADCTNWKNIVFKKGEIHDIVWQDLDNVDSAKDDLRFRGKKLGCAFFARGEGMWYANDYIYFTATTGGKNKLGQIWRYKHIGQKGVDGQIELFFESNDADVLKLPDNITVAPWGDLIISEDGKGA